jgi:hypothetical protein
MGNTETMKGMGRAGRVNVKRKEVETARAINQALLRSHAGVLMKSKNQDETFLTEPTSLEMFATSIRKYPPTR